MLSSFLLLVALQVPALSPHSAQAYPNQSFADLALSCIHREYPSVIKHEMNQAEDLKEPHQLYPAFYGCFDWHSSVHGHWLLVRLLNTATQQVNTKKITQKLSKSFSQENILGELESLDRPGNSTFERPYGLAWFLQLTAELRQSQLPQSKIWLKNLIPLEAQIVENIQDWLPKLNYPIRTGEHSQTAFAFGLMLDWSRVAKNQKFELLLTSKIKNYYQKDFACPLSYEPSGQDFLSPCLAEADLMRRVLTPAKYSTWLSDFFPNLKKGTTGNIWLKPATVTDRTDGKLAHLDGLNLSRAWMLEGIISGLPANDPRIQVLKQTAQAHRKTGLSAILGDVHYMGGHWLGSFATYLQTQRGL